MFVRTVDCSPPETGELGGGQSVLRPYSEHLPFLTHPPPPIECPPSAGTRSRRPKGHVAPPHTPACTSSPKNLHPTTWKPFQRPFPIAVQSRSTPHGSCATPRARRPRSAGERVCRNERQSRQLHRARNT